MGKMTDRGGASRAAMLVLAALAAAALCLAIAPGAAHAHTTKTVDGVRYTLYDAGDQYYLGGTTLESDIAPVSRTCRRKCVMLLVSTPIRSAPDGRADPHQLYAVMEAPYRKISARRLLCTVEGDS